MWSYYRDKSHQIWLWWAVDHATNIPLAFTFGTREHKYLDELLALLSPFSIGTVYADGNFAYQNRLSADMLVTGKKNTQQIERDHLTLKTRIKRLCRKTICFSKWEEIHKAVVRPLLAPLSASFSLVDFLTAQLYCDITGFSGGTI